MNLADAIRMAAQASGASLGQPDAAGAQAPKPAEIFAQPAGSEKEAASVKEAGHGGPVLAKEHKMKHAQDAHEPAHGHNVVRLELVLAPDQLKGFFGAVAKSQHGVLTLREAAHFLRVSQKALEDLAGNGNVPGMMVDGKWRFTRQALEDWLSAQPYKKEA